MEREGEATMLHNQNRMVDRRNKSIIRAKSTDSKQYWNLLKKIVGVGKTKREVPKEVCVEGKVVKGDQVRWVWQQAFKKLGTG